MKFIIDRVSLDHISLSTSISPSEDAILEQVLHQEETKGRLANLNLHTSWFTEGFNHSFNEEKGIRYRDIYRPRWIIELNSLEDLVELKNKVGHELIIGFNREAKLHSILIFDDYL